MSARVGLALYTLREASAADFPGTLGAVADLGFEGVELHDLHGHPAHEVRGLLDELGLAAVSRHAGLDDLEHGLPALADELGALGTDRLVLAWVDPPRGAADAAATAARVAAIAEDAAALGLRLGFHNHWSELEPLDDGSTLLGRLAELPLWFEIDLGWVWVAGADPVEVVRGLGGRAEIVHVKDFRSRAGREFCPVGDGSVGYDRVLPTLADGLEWLLVEQDETDGDALVAVERSLAAVRRFRAVPA